MKILCPGCKRSFEMEHVERGRKVRCQCGLKFLLDDASVVADYSPVDEQPPSKIGPCQIERFLGRGGMGKVYKALHPSLDMPVAVKVLLKEFADDRAFKVRFIQSAKICAQVVHPNIVRIYDCGEENGCVYLILEYLGGGSVQSMLERHGPLPHEMMLDIALDVCKGLIEADRQGIVHRDIKPENILRNADGEYKLSDLGLAKRRAEDPGRQDPSLTMAFASLGTPQYMSPEQAIDARSCDARADLYSLGVTLYEIATGKLPFESADSAELRRLHALSAPEPPSKLRPDLKPELERIILKCLRKRPEERYQSASEVFEDLLALKEGRPLPSEAKTEEPPKLLLPCLLCAGIALAAVCLVLWTGDENEAKRKAVLKPVSSETVVKKPEQSPAKELDPVEKRRHELWAYATSFADAALRNGDSFEQAVANLRAFTEDEDSKEFAEEATKRIEALFAARNAATLKIMNALADAAYPFLAKNDFLKAASLYEAYSGPLAKDTSLQRQTIANSLYDSARKLDELNRLEAESVKAKTTLLLSKVADLLLSGDLKSARALSLTPDALRLLPALKAYLDFLNDAPKLIASSFAPQVGTTLYLTLNGSRAIVSLKKVEGTFVYGEETLGKAKLQRRFDASNLTAQERLRRLPSSLSSECKSLYSGLDAFKSGQLNSAVECFRNAGPLSEALTAKLAEALAASQRSETDSDTQNNAREMK